MSTKSKIYLFTLASIGFSLTGYADCPPPPSSVDPTLSVQVSYDKKTLTYKYQYSIRNGVSAQTSIDWFGVMINQAPASFLSPSHWRGSFRSLNSGPFDFNWGTATVAGSAGKKITGDGTLVEPTYVLKPGATLSGFEITSPQPPGTVQFFAEGFAQPPTSVPTATDDEATPNCAGWDFNNAQLLTQVTGSTTGPSDPGTISVRIRAREEKGLGHCAPIQPKQPTGKLAVLILSTRTFDASQINPSSIMFGPAFAAPTSSKLVDGGIGEQIGKEDERAEWERLLELFDPDSADRKNSHPKNLFLTFDVASLDVQCHLDQALFLRGQTATGQNITGSVSANLVGCDPKDLGKHHKHKIPHRWWPQKDRSQQKLFDGIRRVQAVGQ